MPRGNVPDFVLPLVSAVNLLPLQPHSDKIRLIAIGQAPRRLATEALLPHALAHSRDYILPEQVADGVPAAMDALLHDAHTLVARHGRDDNFMLVSVDASNAFNTLSRPRMLDPLPTATSPLARFISMIYGRTSPPLLILAKP